MQFPNNAARTTEEIMAKIREHLKQEPSPQESHHYNRVYEKVYDVLIGKLGRRASARADQ